MLTKLVDIQLANPMPRAYHCAYVVLRAVQFSQSRLCEGMTMTTLSLLTPPPPTSLEMATEGGILLFASRGNRCDSCRVVFSY